MNNIRFDIKKRIPLAVHLSLCVAILYIPLLVMSRNGIGENIFYSGYVLRTGILMFLFYINYLFLIDKFLFRKQFASYIIINIVLVVGMFLLQNLIFDLFIAIPHKPNIRNEADMPRPPHELKVFSDYLLIVLAIGMSVALKVTKRWYKDSINLEIIKAAQLEADLKNLRSQLNPHFLFNTLNNIYSLITIDETKAQESVHRLSNLLRYILYENEQKFVPIEQELEFTQNYIDLMRLRLSANVKLNVLIKNNSSNKKIISLLFINLIENAFKHGINSGSESFIDIKIFVDQKGVLCTVENSLSNSAENIETQKSGIGLANIQKRLELLYPKNYELQIEKRATTFFILLSLNFNT